MPERPPDPQIARLLADLRSADDARRQSAADEIRQRNVRNGEIIGILKTIAVTDANDRSRRAAARALIALGVPTKEMTRQEKWSDFLIGFLGWFVVTWGLYGLMMVVSPARSWTATLGCLWFPANLLVLTILAFTRPYRALGMLAALAANLLIALLAGALGPSICFMPYFVGN